MDKNVILAIVASVIILIAWPHLVKQPKPLVSVAQTQNQVKRKLVDSSIVINKAQQQAKEPVRKSTLNLNQVPTYKLKDDIFELTFSALGARITQVKFFKYDTNFFSNNTKANSPYFLFEPLNDVLFEVSKKTDKSIVFTSSMGDVIKYTITGDRVLSIDLKSKRELKAKFAYQSSDKSERFGLAKNPIDRERSFMFYTDGDLEVLSKSEAKDNKSYNVSSKWIALSDRYFTMALFPVRGNFTSVSTHNENNTYILSSSIEPLTDLQYKMYIGEKDVDYLRKFDKSLDTAVDYGIYSLIAVPILELMKFIHKFIPNYGWVIIILTILIRLLLFPLQHNSMKSMKKFQELQPQLNKIKEKYKDDKAAMNRETMQFMKTHNVNMAKGCLPLIVQMPVFFALYKVLGNAVELYKEPWGLWIVDLSTKDPLYLLPILMGVAMFIQQKMSPTNLDPAQAKMMYIMPVFMTFIMATLPSGLTLYILFSTVFGAVQQIIVNKQK